MKQFRLPDVGEGLTEAEIVSWKVKPGDTVAVNEIVVEIETAKSLVELPSPFAGVVSELLVAEGTTVDVGTPIISVDDGTEPAARQDPHVPAIDTPAEDQAVEPGLIGGPAPGGRTSVLVGYGPRTTAAVRRPRKGAVPVGASAATAQQAVQTSMMTTPTPVQVPPVEEVPDVAPAQTQPAVDTVNRGAGTENTNGGNGNSGISNGDSKVLAKPPVRKLARDLGIDLTTVTPTGEGGVVTRSDVESAVAASHLPTHTSLGDHAQMGIVDPAARESRVPVKGVRKMTAQAMVASAFTAPHVTEWVTVDVTRSMELVARWKNDPSLADVRVSPLLLVMKALLSAVQRNPGVNATWDEAAQEIVTKHYVNLGIAAATPRGLVVPNIKDADRMSLRQLAEALQGLTETARAGRTQPAEMAGGTMTITNVGVFGIDAGTPIINPGESAILCFGAVRPMPWVVGGAVVVRQVTQLALSFDHRLIDGQLGSLFLADIARVLEDPATALLW